MVHTMVTETKETAAKKVQEEFFLLLFKTRTGSRGKFCEYVEADNWFMRLIRAGGSWDGKGEECISRRSLTTFSTLLPKYVITSFVIRFMEEIGWINSNVARSNF